MGYVLGYANGKLDLAKMTPRPTIAQTGYCLANAVASGAEYLVYAPGGGTFTVDLSATTKALTVEWLDSQTGTTSAGTPVTRRLDGAVHLSVREWQRRGALPRRHRWSCVSSPFRG
jgi:hypothetical protein